MPRYREKITYKRLDIVNRSNFRENIIEKNEISTSGGEKSRKQKFSELGLPGVEIVGAPRGSLLHTVRASQLPYMI